ncbi:hypothetical protein [Mesorhizobium sp. M4B.F.Ca.ET.017.02.2.1]|uniref:hypothetical protein n=1 Tax=Mesorhizobium sp. M4B.F.Ca.ET.017.02.2.1 TaxID=2496649 RepID=UPI000FCA9312|nr:hypothetical protein [Mesorhizobium sp. M4B.F.Ca.ET.017.02.2.1]RVD30180.1 hypothetical protein EN738_07265 [Mesorhizobium sp. M4B.F.Ca.ET.017.02.2.1]
MANPLATNIVTAAATADTAIASLRAALDTIRTNETALLRQLGQNAKEHIQGRSNLAGIAIAKVEGAPPDTRTVQQIAQAAWAAELV